MKITLDLDTYFTIAQVGSSIYGDLLKPNDIDIAIGFKFPFISKKKAWVFRVGKFNFIIFHGYTIQKYVKEFDFDILRGYRTLFTRRLVLFNDAVKANARRTIRQLPRDNELFSLYAYAENKAKYRLYKYKSKLPKGWKLFDLRGNRVYKRPPIINLVKAAKKYKKNVKRRKR